MNPVAVVVVRERVGVSLDNDGDIEGGECIPSEKEYDKFRTSAADGLDGVGGKSGLKNAECEEMFSDIDRRLVLDFRDAVGDDLSDSVIDRMLITSSSGIGLCLYSSPPSSIDWSESSSSGIPKSESVISALNRLLTGTIV